MTTISNEWDLNGHSTQEDRFIKSHYGSSDLRERKRQRLMTFKLPLTRQGYIKLFVIKNQGLLLN